MFDRLVRLIPYALLGSFILLVPKMGDRGYEQRPFPLNPGSNDPAFMNLFEDVTRSAGIASTRTGTDRLIGQAWGDIDQDGWPDLYLTDPGGANMLYQNQGDGTFLPWPAERIDPLADRLSSGAVFADFDNDGYPDLYVLNRSQPNVLFRNDGGKRFIDVTEQAGVGDPYDGKTAAWGDYDGDGFLDLYVANWSCYPDCARSSEGDIDALFRNNGDGTFTNVARLLGSKVAGGGFVASWVDYDNDGDLDLYLVNDVFINERGNALWRNDGPGCDGWCFTEISAEAGADTRLMGMGLVTVDYDNDGDFDFYFSNAGEMVLLNNLGDGRFLDVAAPARVGAGANVIAWGTVSPDFNNDGFPDIYLAVTDILPDGIPHNQLFHNLGNGTFENVSNQLGPGHDGRTLGVAAADYDRDGWVDLVIGDYERGYSLFRNNRSGSASNGRIAVRVLGGGTVNADAIGARVTVETSTGLRQMQEVQSGSSLSGGNSLVLHFGLGSAEIRTLTVRWPDGAEKTIRGLQANHEYTIPYPDPKQDAARPLVQAAGVLVMLVGIALNLRPGDRKPEKEQTDRHNT
ncbi:MAG TPA: CRTAC1 family protein [Anaerolineales bacterium]|nr:CRTAC1 family protein [Anaerolineales bacterium]